MVDDNKGLYERYRIWLSKVRRELTSFFGMGGVQNPCLRCFDWDLRGHLMRNCCHFDKLTSFMISSVNLNYNPLRWKG